ncbi:uncharacterized protein LOC117211506 [Bombus bifarius]|uniref:Uncharacterized protein LOC117211506 n=1 Tax=Bombus bifarius TaxID=103933 RepID=A0A6P8N9W5_9HYME|nr:uncharacterized protein LOC117211506 [Bombus bifarius]XP_033311350.1 uncharacterized protein LOC117211506 [Bombus bifarius]
MTVIKSGENKSTCVRRGECQCSHIDNQTVSSVQESTKSMARDSGHNLQQVSIKDSTLTKENMIIRSMKCLRLLKDVIIENGIKCTFYLLCFHLFNAISRILPDSKEHMEPQNAEKDSDSSRNQSSNGSNETTNMPINYENIDSCISHTALKKPMNISTEKHSFNKTQFPINISQDTELFANKRSNVVRNKFLKSYTQKQRSNFCANKGNNAQIFNQKFTSSDSMHSSSSFPRSFTPYKYRKSNQTNFVYNGEDSQFSNNSPTRPWLKKNETKQRKELSIKFTPTNEKENFIFDEERNKKHPEQRNEKKTQEGNFRRHDPTKYKSHYSRIIVRSKKSKQNNLKYKEMGTQTDSTFSTDKAVQMVSVGTMWPEQEIYENATHKSQDEDTDQKINYMDYILENQRTAEKLLLSIHEQLLSHNAPFSSIDSNEHTCAAPDSNIAANRWSTKFTNSINTSETPTRTSPDFSEVSHSSSSSTDNAGYILLPSVKDEYIPKFCIRPAKVTPPAPSPI